MTALDALRRAGDHGRDRPVMLGAVASLCWLAVVLVLAWLAPESTEAEGEAAPGGWLLWFLGIVLPLVLIWFAVWSARSLARLRLEADELRAALAQMRDMAEPRAEVSRVAPSPPTERRVVPPPPPPPPPRAAQAEARQPGLDLGMSNAPELTPTELLLALNFPDGPEDREAIRCLRLALADPDLARLIRAAQDVVTLLAGQGVYMDDLQIPETDGRLWRRFAQGARGADVSGLAVIEDASALATAGTMLRGDEVFRDVAHHFLRHFDRLLGQRAEGEDVKLLAVLAETRSGRAFLLLAQATGMLGDQAEPDEG